MFAVFPGHGKNKGIDHLIRSSRNLVRVKDPVKQNNLLNKGKQAVVSWLRRFPPTKHDPASFSCDCIMISPKLIHLCVSGLYEELTPYNLKRIFISFNRTFVFTLDATGKFLIVNEQMNVTNISQNQYIHAFTSLNGLDFEDEFQTSDPLVSKDLCQNLMRKLSLDTNMSLSFCQQYLTDAKWNYTNALLRFNEAKANGDIPASAFV